MMSQTILVVDASRFMRTHCARVLIENGYVVVEAENGQQALQQYRAQKPVAVFLEMNLPDVNGLAVLKAMRTEDAEARIAVLTAQRQQSVVLAAMQAGAADFVVKPFEPKRVVKALHKMLAEA